MVYYKCDKCEYTTTRKCDYIKHLNRKNPCMSKDSKMVTNVCNYAIPSQNPHKSLTNPSQILTNFLTKTFC